MRRQKSHAFSHQGIVLGGILLLVVSATLLAFAMAGEGRGRGRGHGLLPHDRVDLPDAARPDEAPPRVVPPGPGRGRGPGQVEVPALTDYDRQAVRELAESIARGRDVFRFDTFGDEAFWGDLLQLHVGLAEVTPRTALAVGLKVDAAALPRELVENPSLIDLDDPAVTADLLRLNAVVGVTGFFDEEDQLSSVGIQCALCHSSVNDAVAEGIGYRLDGWANRDLNVGAIINLSPDLTPIAELLEVDEATVREAFDAWGPGKFDAALLLDGQAFRPDGETAATLIPPAYGLAGVNLHTFTGWGSVPHWNGLVATLEMGGQGTFYDPRLADEERFPIAVKRGADDVRSDPDLVTNKLADLHIYQLALPAPTPPEGSFDPELAEEGAALFAGKADCARCHVPPLYTEPGHNLHTPEEIGIDDFQAQRSPTAAYRTTPLGGLWAHTKGGFYHDGRFETLEEVVRHYDETLELELTDEEVDALVEYLLSL